MNKMTDPKDPNPADKSQLEEILTIGGEKTLVTATSLIDVNYFATAMSLYLDVLEPHLGRFEETQTGDQEGRAGKTSLMFKAQPQPRDPPVFHQLVLDASRQIGEHDDAKTKKILEKVALFERLSKESTPFRTWLDQLYNCSVTAINCASLYDLVEDPADKASSPQQNLGVYFMNPQLDTSSAILDALHLISLSFKRQPGIDAPSLDAQNTAARFVVEHYLLATELYLQMNRSIVMTMRQDTGFVPTSEELEPVVARVRSLRLNAEYIYAMYQSYSDAISKMCRVPPQEMAEKGGYTPLVAKKTVSWCSNYVLGVLTAQQALSNEIVILPDPNYVKPKAEERQSQTPYISIGDVVPVDDDEWKADTPDDKPKQLGNLGRALRVFKAIGNRIPTFGFGRGSTAPRQGPELPATDASAATAGQGFAQASTQAPAYDPSEHAATAIHTPNDSDGDSEAAATDVEEGRVDGTTDNAGVFDKFDPAAYAAKHPDSKCSKTTGPVAEAEPRRLDERVNEPVDKSVDDIVDNGGTGYKAGKANQATEKVPEAVVVNAGAEQGDRTATQAGTSFSNTARLPVISTESQPLDAQPSGAVSPADVPGEVLYGTIAQVAQFPPPIPQNASAGARDEDAVSAQTYQALQSQYRALQEENKRLKAQCESLNHQAESANSLIGDISTAVMDLLEAYGSRLVNAGACESVVKAMHEGEFTQTDISGYIKVIGEGLELILNGLSKTNEKYTALEAEHKLTLAEKEQLSADLSTLRELYEALKSLSERSAKSMVDKVKYDELSKEHEKLKAQQAQCESEYGALNAQYRQSISESDRLSGEVSALAVENRRLEALVRDHEAKLSKANETIEGYVRQLADYKAKIEGYEAEKSNLGQREDLLADKDDKVRHREAVVVEREQEVKLQSGRLQALESKLAGKQLRIALPKSDVDVIISSLVMAKISLDFTPNGNGIFDLLPCTYYSGNAMRDPDGTPNGFKVEYSPYLIHDGSEFGVLNHRFKVRGMLYRSLKDKEHNKGVEISANVYVVPTEKGCEASEGVNVFRYEIGVNTLEITVALPSHGIFSLPAILNADTEYTRAGSGDEQESRAVLKAASLDKKTPGLVSIIVPMFDTYNSSGIMRLQGEPRPETSTLTMTYIEYVRAAR
jgi:hypothetical protein